MSNSPENHDHGMAIPAGIKDGLIEALAEVADAVREADCVCQFGPALLVLRELTDFGLLTCYTVMTDARRAQAEEN